MATRGEEGLDALIRVGGYAPAESSHGRALRHLADRVARLTSGEVEVDVLYNILDLGRPAVDLFDMVAAGELTFCFFSSSYLGARVPELDVLEIPFLFEDLDHAHRALDGELGAALTEATERATPFTILGFWDNGFRHLTNRLHPVRLPEDVRGMRVRLQPNRLHAAMVEAWGGIPVSVELSVGIAAIAAGEVDAQENPLGNTVAYSVDEYHRHVTMSGHLYGARGLFANKEAIAALPDDVAAALATAVGEAIAFQRSVAEQGELDLRLRLEEKGLLFVDLTSDERAAFVAATAPVRRMAEGEMEGRLLELADGA